MVNYNISTVVSSAGRANIQPKNKIYNPANIKKDTFENENKTEALKKSSYPNIINITSPFYSAISPQLLFKIFNNKNYIKSLINRNPDIGKVLNSVGIENPVICTDNLSNITNSHILTTAAYALNTADELGLTMADKKLLEQAAVFHDFGKILMPEEIINKPDKLEQNERKIIDTHAEIGAELLETAGMSKKITNLIRYHHKPSKDDVLCNILSAADIYSALREERSYKKTMSREDAFSVLDQKAEGGEVSKEAVEALKKSLGYNKKRIRV